MTTFETQQVPPPSKAPVDQIAETLGLVDGLRAQRPNSQFRCANCRQMQKAGEWLVWVPDGVRKEDPFWAVEEACRLSARNGSGSGWCLSCAPKKALPTSLRGIPNEHLPCPQVFETPYRTPLQRFWHWVWS